MASFDYRMLWEALEHERVRRGLTKTAMVNDIAWLSAGVIKRLERGEPTSCQHATGLLRWLGRSPESFLDGVRDDPAHALPDVGAFAIRWSMPRLWAAVDDKRESMGLSWQELEDDFGWPGMRTFGKDVTYGIPMDLAMRVTQWLGVPAATFMERAEPAPDGVKSRAWGTAE